MSLVKNVDHVITSEGMTTGRHSVSDATIQNLPTYSYSIQAAEDMAKIKQLLMEEYIQTFQHQYQSLFAESTDLAYRNYLRRAAGGMQTASNSASPTETKTENLSVFKDVTTTPKGQLKPST